MITINFSNTEMNGDFEQPPSTKREPFHEQLRESPEVELAVAVAERAVGSCSVDFLFQDISAGLIVFPFNIL